VPSSRAERGRRAEERAARYLSRHGYRIRDRSFRTRVGEIDLIAEQGDCLVFVEVRFRSRDDFGGPEESVTPQKQRRIARTALLYLQRKGLMDRVCRFDVVAVRPESSGKLSVRHIPNAFQPG
jgi:putative endonuclease